MTQGFQYYLSAMVLLAACACAAQQPEAYAGFDRNVYPGDGLLTALRPSFQFTGYWLNNPPGASTNSWAGKRDLLKRNGFGFLVLFRGRTDADLKGKDAAALGAQGGKAAVAAARREGFQANVLIFLDQEEGGRLLPEQVAYLFAWVDAVRAAGARAGVYCSAIDAPDGAGTITTAEDIAQREAARAMPSSKSNSAERERLAIWIANDQCPPSPGCTLSAPSLSSGVPAALQGTVIVWQYALSPRRTQFSAGCPENQAPDGMCYAPGLPHSAGTFVDLDTADSPDPSETQ